MQEIVSFSRLPRVTHRRVIALPGDAVALPALTPGETLALHGAGRSYSDVALNPGGALATTAAWNRILSFDGTTGRILCEGGVSLGAILDRVAPAGWFLPVVPGTRHVTVGGAIACDIHGKNHAAAGSFGHHVRALDLLRSDGARRLVAGDDWLRATIGGLGLTGAIIRAELQLMPVESPVMEVDSRRFSDLEAYWPLAAASAEWPYAVAWVDSTSPAGRGILYRARHAPAGATARPPRATTRSLPFDPPFPLINRLTVALHNRAYYHRPLPAGTRQRHYQPYFFPLDAIDGWNRLYGRSGFYQFQCVVPAEAVAAVWREVARDGSGSCLAVLKSFGPHAAPGMLSFARPGTTLALDFPNRGDATLALLSRLDAIVREAGGALYPAKDSRMSSRMFRHGFPAWEAFGAYVDPVLSSGFWRRVSA